MFKINTEELQKCSTQLNTYADALNNNGNRLLDVCSALSGLGGMEVVIDTIQALSENLKKESGLTGGLGDAAGRIAHKYGMSEEQIFERIENSVRDLKNSDVSISNFDDRSNMDKSVKETMEDVDKLIN